MHCGSFFLQELRLIKYSPSTNLMMREEEAKVVVASISIELKWLWWMTAEVTKIIGTPWTILSKWKTSTQNQTLRYQRSTLKSVASWDQIDLELQCGRCMSLLKIVTTNYVTRTTLLFLHHLNHLKGKPVKREAWSTCMCPRALKFLLSRKIWQTCEFWIPCLVVV